MPLKRHADNSGSHADLWLLKFAIAQSNGSALLKIPLYNTTWSALHKHEWSKKKVERPNRERQLYKCHEPWSQPHFTLKPVGRTAITSYPFSKYSKHFTWSGFRQKEGKLHRFRANPRRLITDKLSRDSAILLNNYFTHLSNRNLLHPGFQGVRWTRDRPMPGPFPAPPNFIKGKALGTRLVHPLHPPPGSAPGTLLLSIGQIQA